MSATKPAAIAKTTPTGPAPAPAGPVAILLSVRLREPQVMIGTTPTEEVLPFAESSNGHWDVAVVGPAVIVAPPARSPGVVAMIKQPGVAELAESGGIDPREARIAFEVPRHACVLRWLIPAGQSAADAARSIYGGGFSAVHASPGEVVLRARERRRVDAEQAKEAAKRAPRVRSASEGPEHLGPGIPDGEMGSGPAGSAGTAVVE